MAKHTITIEGWHPARLNELIGVHWSKAAKRKRFDADMIALHSDVPEARGKRIIKLTIVLGPRQRAGDPDAYWKSLLDALVRCGLLVDDNRQNVEYTFPTFVRGEEKATIIELEDI